MMLPPPLRLLLLLPVAVCVPCFKSRRGWGEGGGDVYCQLTRGCLLGEWTREAAGHPLRPRSREAAGPPLRPRSREAAGPPLRPRTREAAGPPLRPRTREAAGPP